MMILKKYIFSVSPEEKMIGSESSGVAILTLPSVEEADEGTYACVARNDAGIQEERIQVTVQDNDIDSEPVRGDISGKSSYSKYSKTSNCKYKLSQNLPMEGLPFRIIHLKSLI